MTDVVADFDFKALGCPTLVRVLCEQGGRSQLEPSPLVLWPRRTPVSDDLRDLGFGRLGCSSDHGHFSMGLARGANDDLDVLSEGGEKVH